MTTNSIGDRLYFVLYFVTTVNMNLGSVNFLREHIHVVETNSIFENTPPPHLGLGT